MSDTGETVPPSETNTTVPTESDDPGDDQQDNQNEDGYDNGYYDVEGEEEETPISLEELRRYMQDPATDWGTKDSRLRQFIAYHDLTPLSCISLPSSNGAPAIWENIKTARQNASGDLRILFDEFIGLFDGVDADAMFAELEAISVDPSIEEQYKVYDKYGFNYDAIADQIAELSVRYKVDGDESAVCIYDIDYSLPE